MKFYTLFLSLFIISSFVKVKAACGPADFTVSDTCSNTPANFIGSGGDAGTVYTWDFGDGSPTVTGLNVNHLYAGNGSYTVTLTLSGSCSGTISKTVNISTTPLTVDISDVLVCTVPYTYTATGGSPGATYLWSNGQTGSSISVSDAGRYWVKTSLLGCSFTDTAKVGVWGQGNKGDNIWTFGNGGFDFTGNPSPSSLTGTVFTTGSSSIATPSGNLLFYTDGQAIYDKNNVPLVNGTGLTGTSSTQPAVIVPDPRSNNIYYVFTSSPTSGLSYSVVDMSLNGGLGEVTNLNVPLASGATAGVLSGLSDSAGGFWTTSYDATTNQMIAYKIGNSGLISTPVSSASGLAAPASSGSLKFSQDGKKAALVVPGQNLVVVYDFDRATGTFSNPAQVTTTSPVSVAFSTDNSKLYIDGNSNLFQYDLTSIATPPVAINTGQTYGDMVLGPDGRIYVAIGGGKLGIINDPSFPGTQSNYKDTTTLVASNLFLPNFIANYFITKNWGIAYADTCSGSPTLFQFTAPDTVTNWTWSFDGVADPQVNYPASQTTQHTFTTAGPHTVSIHVNHHCGSKDMSGTINIVATPVVNLLPSYTVCIAGDSVLLDAGTQAAGATFLWSTGQTTQKIYAKDPLVTNYSVTVTNGACVGSGSTTVNFMNNTGFNLGRDTTLCYGLSLTLNTGNYPAATSTTWNGSAGGQTYNVTSSGQYIAVVNFASCSITDTINVKVLPQLVANLGLDDTLCNTSGSKLLGPVSNPAGTKYVWYKKGFPGTILSSTNSYSVPNLISNSGDYVLLDSINHCSVADTIHIEFVAPPTVKDLGATNTYCVNTFQTLDAGNAGGVPGVSYLWSPNGATTQTTTYSSGLQGPVTISVTVTIGKGGVSGGCSASDNVVYNYVTPPVITFPSTMVSCANAPITLDADPGNNYPGFTYYWNPTGETTRKIDAKTSGNYAVLASNGSCHATSNSVNITINPLPAATLPSDVVYCKTKQTSVDIVLANADPTFQYTWSTGETNVTQITVTQEGTYSVQIVANNCPKHLTTNVVSICEPQLYIPSAFSPNGDGINQEFKLFGESLEQLDFRIFDRWGEIIFVATDLSKVWDGTYKGKPVQEGVYVWKVEYSGKNLDGTLTKHIKEGDLTVIK